MRPADIRPVFFALGIGEVLSTPSTNRVSGLIDNITPLKPQPGSLQVRSAAFLNLEASWNPGPQRAEWRMKMAEKMSSAGRPKRSK
jgi:hypothetical protein